mmetsp:Transcript_52359/g.78242  ORF Transcript_52359/g.78242 Transcript_52359/m.78242 type:complete len:368 (-) Transcript_52359:37-1140(-)
MAPRSQQDVVEAQPAAAATVSRAQKSEPMQTRQEPSPDLPRRSHQRRSKQHEEGEYRPSPPPPPEIQGYLPMYLRKCVFPLGRDFCQTPFFDPRLIVQLMAEGFLPIAAENVLLPKLHEERCVIPLPANFHIRKSTRKKAHKFNITFNKAFDQVVQNCHEQHEHCWLHPPLVQAFRIIWDQHPNGVRAILENRRACSVRIYSTEVWDTDGNLVAGELGYSVGCIYTSLTGFSFVDSAGSVQLAALGSLLCKSGFQMFDLGMWMEYKESMGAILMPRREYVDFVHAVRSRDSHVRLPSTDEKPLECRQVIDEFMGVGKAKAQPPTGKKKQNKPPKKSRSCEKKKPSDVRQEQSQPNCNSGEDTDVTMS